MEEEDNGEFGWANPIPLDDSISGLIGETNDEDWYRFDVSQAGQLTVALTSVPLESHAQVPSLQQLQGTPAVRTAYERRGVVFAHLRYHPNLTPIIYWWMTWTMMPFHQRPTPIPFHWWTYRIPMNRNDDYGDARTLSQINRINGYIFETGDHDWFRISVAQAGDLRIVLSDLPENITPQIDLYNMSKDHLAGKGGTAGMDMELIYTVPEAGQYLVRISDGGNNDESTQPYTMTIHGADFATYAPTARIDQIDPGVHRYRQQHYLLRIWH